MAELRTRVIREVSSAPDSERRTTTDVYLCGECGIILAQGLPPGEVENSAARCPNCFALNDFGSWLPRPERESLKVCPSCHKRRRHPDQRVCGCCWWK